MSLPSVISTNDEFEQYIETIQRDGTNNSCREQGTLLDDGESIQLSIFDDFPIASQFPCSENQQETEQVEVNLGLHSNLSPLPVLEQQRETQEDEGGAQRRIQASVGQENSGGGRSHAVPYGYETFPEQEKAGRRARGWVFTWNNYDPTTWHAIQETTTGDEVTYIVCGREVAPTTGTHHLQGYIYFRSLKSFGQCLHYLTSMGINRQGHPFIAIARGTAKQNRDYCTKSGEFCERGVIPGKDQGKRTDLDAVYESVTSGKSMNELIEEHPTEMIKYAKNIMLINNLINYQTQRTTRPRVYWFFGPTGSGKSRLANEIAKKCHSFYYKNPAHKWWDGYTQQECIVIDDYRRDFCTFAELLRLLDWYPYSVECKGGTLGLNSACIIFTSPKAPRATWENRSEEDLAQLTRRIDSVIQFPRHYPTDLASIMTQIQTPP